MKINWNLEELKKEFLIGDYKTLKEFAEAKGLNYSSLRNKAKGWLQEKAKLLQEKNKKVIEKVLEQRIEKETDYNLAHLKAWDELLNIVLEVLHNKEQHLMTRNGKINIYALERVANILEKIQKGQRLALGLDEQQQKQSEEILTKLQQIVGALNDDNVQSEAEAVCEEGEEEA